MCCLEVKYLLSCLPSGLLWLQRWRRLLNVARFDLKQLCSVFQASDREQVVSMVAEVQKRSWHNMV